MIVLGGGAHLFTWPAAALLGAGGLLAAALLLLARSCRRVAAAQAVAGRRLDEQVARLMALAARVERHETVLEAQELDARSRHDGDLIEILGPLRDLNDALRPPQRSAPRDTEVPR